MALEDLVKVVRPKSVGEVMAVIQRTVDEESKARYEIRCTVTLSNDDGSVRKVTMDLLPFLTGAQLTACKALVDGVTAQIRDKIAAL